ncbi:DUF4080 domain-containing protein [Pontiella sp.]|uniref:B12-binding domain-containing radical SAM protein n=1 Tax=Pontiella sp. TaxID=2837462 RepID=UPI00356B4203
MQRTEPVAPSRLCGHAQTGSSDVVLVAFNARYAHTAFGARYLLANLGELAQRTALLEFDLQEQPRIAVEKILARNPRIVGIGCYIWNIDLATKVAALLKSIRPATILVLGGPEISYETEEQEIFHYADHVICGEGEAAFPELCNRILNHKAKNNEPGAPSSPLRLRGKTIHAGPVDVAKLALPYDLYSDEDIAHRAIYVEASRGCPFRCEYCMSSLDNTVRYFPEEKLFAAFGRLLERGARSFKFVDRTFNIDIPFALKVLAFFRERHKPGMMLHFEVIPDRLPDELLDAVKECPPGMLQFEIGIQTFNEAVAHRIQRPLDIGKIETNMRRLRAETGVHIHSDLIAGLPGEDLQSFEAGFNRLLALNPQEIQLGILKRLRGAPIARHTAEWNMVYSPHAPYEILSTGQIPFEQMQRIQRFARYWNLVVNNGQFIETAPLIWSRRAACETSRLPAASAVPQAAGRPETDSAFAAFLHFSDWLYARTNTTGNLHMVRLAKLLMEYLSTETGLEEKFVATALWADYQRGNRPDVPGFLKKFGFEKSPDNGQDSPSLLPRQARHLKD